MTSLLETAALSVGVGEKLLLRDMSLSFARGETVALIGPNGAGKSTLLRALAGELAPRSGHIRLLGRELRSYSPGVLAGHRAVLSQRNNVAFPFTIGDVVRMGGLQANTPVIESIVDGVLAEFGLIDLADRPITTLSGGEQQRAHFARVLAQLAWGQSYGGCGILLLDEPMAGLDLRHQLGMLTALKRRARNGVLVIAVLHDLNLAALFADRVIVLDRGRIDCEGSLEETITDGMLERVFKIQTRVSSMPFSRTPFVLPQAMTAVSYFSD